MNNKRLAHHQPSTLRVQTYVQVVGRLDNISIMFCVYGYTDIVVPHISEQLYLPAKCTLKGILHGMCSALVGTKGGGTNTVYLGSLSLHTVSQPRPQARRKHDMNMFRSGYGDNNNSCCSADPQTRHGLYCDIGKPRATMVEKNGTSFTLIV